MASRPVIAHGHIFKNAGTTLDWALQRNFGRGFLDHRDDEPMRNEGAAHLAQLLEGAPHVVAVSSHHMCFPFPQIDGVEIIGVYLLRHPIERVLSVYEFERRQRARTPGALNAKRMDIAEYVRWRLQPDAGATVRDYQVRYLAGRHRGPKRGVTEDDFRVAGENLRQSHIGIVEKFDVSLVLIERELRPLFPGLDLAYVPQNVNRSRAQHLADRLEELECRLGPELFDELKQANRFDLRLYALAQALLKSRCGEVADLERALEEFQHRCRELEKT